MRVGRDGRRIATKTQINRVKKYKSDRSEIEPRDSMRARNLQKLREEKGEATYLKSAVAQANSITNLDKAVRRAKAFKKQKLHIAAQVLENRAAKLLAKTT